jgi:predicted flap endonuclease-1-like 5' DNA nuclease
VRRSQIAGILAAIGAAVAIIWVLKDRVAAPKPVGTLEPAEVPPAPPAKREAAKATAETDDLTTVKGIGPVYRARLSAAGFTSFAALAAAKPADVAAAAEVPEARAEDWVAQAASLARR